MTLIQEQGREIITVQDAYRKQYQADCRQIENALSGYFTSKPNWAILYDAMRYSLLAGGKRVRPVLTLAFCRLFGGEAEKALPFACALEMIHTYSLIHDDLPCMDNDDLRRGRPTCHKVYGDAMALLAGDGLLTAAFETLTSPASCRDIPPERTVQAVRVLSRAAGAAGMVGGQTLDMAGVYRSLSAVTEMHQMKTGALLCAASELGCVFAGAGEAGRLAASSYASHLGLAFQVRDDMLDVEGTETELGKKVGADAADGKITFAALWGLEECKRVVAEETALAVKALADLGDVGYLSWLAGVLADRKW